MIELIDQFSPLIGLGLFCSYALLDSVYAVYTLAIVKKRKAMAANMGSAVYLLTAFGIINYVDNWLYIIPMLMGGWIGTYLTLYHVEKRERLTTKQ